MRLAVAETAAELPPAGNCLVVAESFLAAQIAAVEIAVAERPVEVA